jgi:hypothetical protein
MDMLQDIDKNIGIDIDIGVELKYCMYGTDIDTETGMDIDLTMYTGHSLGNRN